MCTYLSHTHLAQLWARQHVKKVTCWCKHCIRAGCVCMHEGGRETANLPPAQLQAANSHDVPQKWSLGCGSLRGLPFPTPTPVSRQRLTDCRHCYAGDDSHLFVTCGNSFCSWLRKPAGGVCRAVRGPLKTKNHFQFPLKSNLLQ